ncbi:MAG: M1 family metallopeptidase [Candidatus Micrarchaeaceae archaeon]
MPLRDKGTKVQERYDTLGDNVIPKKYTLRFKPNFTTFKYDGSEIIEVEIKARTTSISLNAAELDIKTASVVQDGIEQRAATKLDPSKQTVTLALRKGVKGSALIKIAFAGVHNDSMYGFYRSRYNSGGKAKYLLTTQFEAANARNAFPCFDEPAFKAVFDVSIVAGKGLDCISNMPVSRVNDFGEALKEVKFEETPRMSTYLLYLGVGNYDYANGSAGNTKVRVVTVPGSRAMAKLPLEYAIKFIKFYEKYFGIKYPLPKVDLIAIPDFAAGAMENWGAITFRETALLADGKSPIAVKQRVAEVIAHELAHQWFGDLVTMKWWNDLWLNESFATFMSYKAMDAVFPEWEVKVEYLQNVINTAFIADQLRSTHPISVPVTSPGEIDQLFDEISYEKGGTVLNTIESYVGSGTLRSGLNKYLKKHSYSNATKFDLWRAIDEAAVKRHEYTDVYAIANYWVNTPGYPVIDAKRNAKGVMLSQTRYFLLSNMSSDGAWPIPVDYLVDGKEHKLLFDRKTAQIKAAKDQWVKLNFRQNGMYRVNYEAKDLSRLGELINGKKITGMDSWGIESDIFARSRSGRMPADNYLEFVGRYCLDGDHPLDASVLSHLGWIYYRLGSENNARARELILLYSNRLIDRLGWERDEDEVPYDTQMRSAAIMISGMIGYAPTVEKAGRLFYDFIRHGKAIDPNIRGVVYSLAAWSGGDEVFSILKERFSREKVPDEKVRLLRATAMFNDKGMVLKAFDFAMSGEVRLQDSFMVPAIAASNPAAREILLPWTERNWKELRKRYASGTHMLIRFIDNFAVLGTEKDKAEIESFFRKNRNFRDDIGHALDKSLEQIEANIRFLKANKL